MPGTEDYTLDADIGKIIDIYGGNNNSLLNISLKEYHNYKKADPALGQSGEGTPGWYLYIGRAADNSRKIRIGNIPTDVTTLTGFGKLRTTRFVDSDLGTAKSMLPYPADGEGVLSNFVQADIFRLQDKKDLIFPQEVIAKESLKEWRGEESTEPANTATSGLPAYLRSKLINRRRGYVV